MNKKDLIQKFILKIQAEYDTAKRSAETAHAAAIHSESKPEDQYDTRGLEASYLAGAQAKRVLELEEVLTLYRNIDIKSFNKDSTISATALITLQSEEGKISHCLMMPKGGGMNVQFESKTVQVVTPQSPLGEALLGKKSGDSVDAKIQNTSKEFEILSVE